MTNSPLMAYRALLTRISDDLPTEDVYRLLFLCGGRLSYSSTESIETGHQLFHALEIKNLISYDNTVLLKILLIVIGRIDLANWLPGNDFESDDDQEFKSICHQYVNPFEHLLFKISDQLPMGDVLKLRFAYGRAPRNAEISSALDLFKIMQRLNDLAPEKLDDLVSMLEAIHRPDQVAVIKEFLLKYADDRMRSSARRILGDTELSQPQTTNAESHRPSHLTSGMASLSVSQNQTGDLGRVRVNEPPGSQTQILPRVPLASQASPFQWSNPPPMEAHGPQHMPPVQRSESTPQGPRIFEVSPVQRSESAPSSSAAYGERSALLACGGLTESEPQGTSPFASQTFLKTVVSGQTLMPPGSEIPVPGDSLREHTRPPAEISGLANPAPQPGLIAGTGWLEEARPDPAGESTLEAGAQRTEPPEESVSAAPSGGESNPGASSPNGAFANAIHMDENIVMSQRSAQVSQEPAQGIDASDKYKYKMKAMPRGKCLVINNYEFFRPEGITVEENLRERRGSDKDEENLKRCFKKLNFAVEAVRNVESAHLIELLQRYCRMDHREFDCFVCCILSHGTEDRIYCSDSVTMKITDITSYFSAKLCPSLAGKPKLFFLSCCLGRSKPEAVLCPILEPAEVFERDGGTLSGSDQLYSEVSDFLYGYATMAGFSSFRDVSKGTLYVQALTEIFEQHHKEKHVLDMLTMVNERLSDKALCIDGKYYKQVGAPQSTLRKQVWF